MTIAKYPQRLDKNVSYRIQYLSMMTIQQTDHFAKWLADLEDRKARGIIVRRIERLKLGNFGDSKSVGDGVTELRIDFGPGYRVYFTRRGKDIVILLCGGSKRTQDRDIKSAKDLAQTLLTQNRHKP